MNSVELLGYYGGDSAHALSAWTSTSRDLNDEKRARIPALLAKLAKDGHHTPFEKSSLHFLIEVETASHIHLLKHRVGVSINGESARYKEIKENKHYIPQDWPHGWKDLLEEHTKEGERLYHTALCELTVGFGFSKKRAKESARFFLGYNNILTMDVMFNFRSFMHFQTLRNDDHAQDEIHWIARDMLHAVKELTDDTFKHSLASFGW